MVSWLHRGELWSTRPLDFSGTVTVPRYSGLVVGTQMVESDLEGIEGRRDILDTFRTGY